MCLSLSHLLHNNSSSVAWGTLWVILRNLWVFLVSIKTTLCYSKSFRSFWILQDHAASLFNSNNFFSVFIWFPYSNLTCYSYYFWETTDSVPTYSCVWFMWWIISYKVSVNVKCTQLMYSGSNMTPASHRTNSSFTSFTSFEVLKYVVLV